MWQKRIWSPDEKPALSGQYFIYVWRWRQEGEEEGGEKKRLRDSSCFPPLDHIVGHAYRVTLSLPVICQRFQYPPPRSCLLGAIPTSCKHSHGVVLDHMYDVRAVMAVSCVTCLTWKTKIWSVIVVVISDKLLELQSSYFTFMEDSEFHFIYKSWQVELIDWGCYTEIVVRKCIIKIRVRMMGLSVTTNQCIRQAGIGRRCFGNNERDENVNNLSWKELNFLL